MTTSTRAIEAWVLHKQWTGDTSARVSFITREAGLIQCFYKGGRTPKKQALLQAFTHLWISVSERYDRYYAQTIDSMSPTLQFPVSNSLFAGLYVNEILYYALKPNYPDTELFDAYLFTLNGLAATKDKLILESLLRRFEWTLLKSCGYSFSFTHEARTTDLIVADLYYQFVAGEGFVLARSGIIGAHILALAQDDLSDSTYLKSAKIIMRQAIDHLLGGKEIKARALYLMGAKVSNSI